MDIVVICLLLVAGLVLIIKGGDYFVDGASWLAEVSGIPKFIVGATIVSVATTLPEIVFSLISSRCASSLNIKINLLILATTAKDPFQFPQRFGIMTIKLKLAKWPETI